jgi:hypothetical protein
MSFNISNHHPSSFSSHLDTIPFRVRKAKMRPDSTRQVAANGGNERVASCRCGQNGGQTFCMTKRKTTVAELAKTSGQAGKPSAALAVGYANLLADLKARVRAAQLRAVLSVIVGKLALTGAVSTPEASIM